MHHYVAIFTAYSLAKKIKILKWYEGEAGSTLPVLERKDKGRKLCLLSANPVGICRPERCKATLADYER